jgi:hypothetical protein
MDHLQNECGKGDTSFLPPSLSSSEELPTTIHCVSRFLVPVMEYKKRARSVLRDFRKTVQVCEDGSIPVAFSRIARSLSFRDKIDSGF